MTRLHYEEDQFDELTAWAETIRDRVQSIDGLLFADLVRTGPGEGMVMAGYDDESDFEGARDTVMAIFDDMSRFLTDTPHGHAGTVVTSWKPRTD